MAEERMTAEAARPLMPSRHAETCIREIEGLIEAAAKQDRTSVQVPYKMWEGKTDNGGAPLLDVEPMKSIVAHFSARGFEVREYYEARQFVDAGVRISWGGDDG